MAVVPWQQEQGLCAGVMQGMHCQKMADHAKVCRCNIQQEELELFVSYIAACSPGTFRTLSNSSCQQCPGNTRRDAEAASVCRCLDGFYRNDPPQEGPETTYALVKIPA